MHIISALRTFAATLGLLLLPGLAAAQVFEVVHPDVVENGFELEILNGASLGNVANGEERSAHEIALGYGFTDFWKSIIAIEIANPEGGAGAFEAIEWENIILLPFGEGHSHGHDHSDHGFAALESVGVLLAFELPNAGGLDEGAMEIGPIAEIAIGPFETVSNLTFELPFADGANVGMAYALQAKYPLGNQIGIGFEAFGNWENVFESNAEGSHLIGPALFGELNLGRGRVLEPKLSTLVGLTDNAPDVVVSLNFELKF